MPSLKHAIREMKEHLELNGGYGDEDRGPDDDDAIEALMDDCGQNADGECSLAGTEYCDWECPFSG